MARRILPVHDTLLRRTPTADALRQRLGGRGRTEPGAGELVLLGPGVPGVVLFAQGPTRDVWLGDNRVQRVDASALRPAPREGFPEALLAVAADLEAFLALEEGQRVRVSLPEGREEQVLLIEKCRFGALLERDDGKLLGVGFRRVAALGPQDTH